MELVTGIDMAAIERNLWKHRTRDKTLEKNTQTYNQNSALVLKMINTCLVMCAHPSWFVL